jgi:hypothetical protein
MELMRDTPARHGGAVMADEQKLFESEMPLIGKVERLEDSNG